MKLDRNLPENAGRGKYALLLLRRLDEWKRDGAFAGHGSEIDQALKVLEEHGLLDWGNEGTESEFFLIRLKDRCARAALDAYANVAEEILGDKEYADEIREMAGRSGPYSPWCKNPD